MIATNTGTDDNLSISNNKIGSTVSSNQIGLYGLFLYSNVKNALISQNEIFGFNRTSTFYGMNLGSNITNSIFSKNKIHDIISTNASVIGIYISSNTCSNLNFDNNIIYNLGSVAAGYGILVNGGNTCSFYYNSINLTGDRDAFGTNKANAASYAFNISGTSTALTLKNNIFQNSQVAATNPTVTKSYAIYNAGSSAIFSAINYNDYFVSGAQGVLAFQGSDILTLAGWQAVNTGDLNSISADPQFNSPSNLQPSISSPVMAAGTPITGLATDITGTARNLTKPSMGAYETGNDVTGPVIIYTAFQNTSSTTARTLTATITDPSGVATSGLGLPVLYWKKNSAGSWIPVQGVSIGSDQFTFSFGSGVVAGDTISYYVAAQDNYSTQNVSVFPALGASGFTANPPAVSTVPSTPSVYHILGAMPAGNYDIGGSGTTPCATCSYVDLTAAFADIYNNKEITGAINLNLTSFYKSTEEDAFPITINPLFGASVTNTVTIKPASGTSDTISGNSTISIIRIYGADYIIIDGSNNGTDSRNLVIQNTSTSNTRAAILISSLGIKNGATNNTIKNSIIMAGSYNATNYGIHIGSTVGASGDDNDNNTIINNLFKKVYYGIYAMGTINGMQDNLTILNNTLGDTALANGIGRYGIAVNQNTGFNISNNTISNSNATGSILYGIYVFQSNKGIVSNNKITNLRSLTNNLAGIYLGTSVVQTKIISNQISGIKYFGITQNGGGKGIDINTANSNSNLLIANNMVSDISGSGTGNLATNAIVGIRIGGTTGTVDLYHNTVNLSGKISHTGTTICKNAALYIASAVTALDIRNNIFTNSILDTLGANTSYAIYSDAAVGSFKNLNYNNYYVSDSQSMLGYIGMANDTTLEAWKIASKKDSNSLNVDPFYVSDVDLHISNVYLNNTGDTIGKVSDDIDGEARSIDHPDMGADEFGLKAVVTTLGSDQILGSKATVFGKLNPMNEYNTVVAFEYGTSTAYGFTATAVESPVQGMKDSAVSANLTGLLPQTTYHYRIMATTSAGISYGKDSTLTTTVSIKENQTVKEAEVYLIGNKLVIQFNNDISDAQIMVYNLFGKEMINRKMTGKQIELDLTNAATGYYLVSISTSASVMNRKVFVK